MNDHAQGNGPIGVSENRERSTGGADPAVDRSASGEADRGLRRLIASGRRTAPLGGAGLEAFLAEPSPWRALSMWLGGGDTLDHCSSNRDVALLLNRDIAVIDRILNRQVNAILHHPAVQRLEASWRGLRYLVEHADDMAEPDRIQIRVLSVSWKEIARDAERALEFDQSQLFRRIYDDEFGRPGGEPYGLLLADYEVRHRVSAEHPTDDVTVLESLAGVAAAAFAPLVIAAHPALFGLERFAELELPVDLEALFRNPEYSRWRGLRKAADSRFLGLTVPRVLMRRPYADGARPDGFRFREATLDVEGADYLWGSGVYAYGAIVIRAFAESGWFADLRGVRPDEEAAGVVPEIPTDDRDPKGLLPKPCTDVVLTSRLEKQLGELGFLSLCQCKGTTRAAFYGSDSIHEPESFDDPAANASAKLSSMLHYMLCVSRFAHYIKVLARTKIGEVTTPEECERFLGNWLLNYITGGDEISAEIMAKYPLKEARVDVSEQPGRPDRFRCTVHLRPHFQLDHVVSSVKLVTELAPTGAG